MSGRHTQAQPRQRGRVTTLVAVGLLAVLTTMVTAMVLLWPGQPKEIASRPGQSTASATITAIHRITCPDTSGGTSGSGQARPAGCGTADVVITDDDGGHRKAIANLPAGAAAPDVSVNDDVTM